MKSVRRSSGRDEIYTRVWIWKACVAGELAKTAKSERITELEEKKITLGCLPQMIFIGKRDWIVSHVDVGLLIQCMESLVQREPRHDS